VQLQTPTVTLIRCSIILLLLPGRAHRRQRDANIYRVPTTARCNHATRRRVSITCSCGNEMRTPVVQLAAAKIKGGERHRCPRKRKGKGGNACVHVDIITVRSVWIQYHCWFGFSTYSIDISLGLAWTQYVYISVGLDSVHFQCISLD